MRQLRRSPYILIRIDETQTFSVAEFLQGTTRLSSSVSIALQSGLTGISLALSPEEFLDFSKISAEQYVAENRIELSSSNLFEALISGGFLICDRPTSKADERNLQLHETAENSWWEPTALAFHRHLSQAPSDPSPMREYADLLRNAQADADKFTETHGSPPPESYVHPECQSDQLLALPETKWQESHLGKIMRSRHTNRIFSRSQRLSISQVAELLEATFRPHSFVRLGKSVTMLRKTSPSGGSLHPIEVFLSAAAIDNVEPGIYHYRTTDHALQAVKKSSEVKTRALNRLFANSQDYAEDAAALLILVARFDRHHWKYRNNPRTLAVMYTDAGHLSQSVYLVAQKLGLANFYSGSIDSSLISKQLGIDQVRLAPLGICGCGIPDPDGELQELEPTPYL